MEEHFMLVPYQAPKKTCGSASTEACCNAIDLKNVIKQIEGMPAAAAIHKLHMLAVKNSFAEEVYLQLKTLSRDLQWMSYCSSDLPLLCGIIGLQAEPLVKDMTRVQIIDYLLSVGFNPNSISSNQIDLSHTYTPLCLACTWGTHPDIIKCLLLAGAPVNQASLDGMTPLMCASGSRQTNVCEKIKYLLAFEANPLTLHILPTKMQTACDYAIFHARDPKSRKDNELIGLLEIAEKAWLSGEQTKQVFINNVRIDLLKQEEKMEQPNLRWKEWLKNNIVQGMTTVTTTIAENEGKNPPDELFSNSGLKL